MSSLIPSRTFRNSALALAIVFLFCCSIASAADFKAYTPGQKISGFKVASLYTDGDGNPVGARFVSTKYSFIVDLFHIESVPQAFYWIKTPPKWDKGEPHTCEHLLLGKGNVGRGVAALEEMTLGNSTAYTDQLVTCYHFNTVAGNEAFFQLFEAKLNALLNPDFTDEEIRREVAHVGATEDADGKLWVEEKGTVYTEMVSNYEKPWGYLWEPMDEMVFGPDHPCANISGGRPDALRQMVPADLWEFHQETHVLSNMGVIVSIPPSIKTEVALERLESILSRCQKKASKNDDPSISAKGLPPAAPSAPPGAVLINGYPSENQNDPGEILFSWPANLQYDLEEEKMLEIFLGILANGSSSRLYETFFNSSTRRIDLGAGYCFGTTSRYTGHPIRIALGNIASSNIDSSTIEIVRSMILEEITRISKLESGSAELAKLNERALAILTQYRKNYDRILDTPPQFGFRRGPAGFWLSHLEGLEAVDGFKKSLVMKDVFGRIEARLNSKENVWSTYISKWKLTSVTPYVVAIRPDPNLLASISKAKEDRLRGYVDQYKTTFGANDDQEALKTYRDHFDELTASLEKLGSNDAYPSFVESPPLTFDPELKSFVKRIGGIDLVTSQFDNIRSATMGVAFDLSRVPDTLLLYVPMLPTIVTSIGVTFEGDTLTHSEVETRLRKEILHFSSDFSTSEATGRAELVIRASGANQGESLLALKWIEAGLLDPLITEENLPRLIDVVSQRLNGLRNRMKSSEEDWVDVPFYAILNQSNQPYLAAESFMTQAHFVQRLKWRLIAPRDVLERADLMKFVHGFAPLMIASPGRATIDAQVSRDALLKLLDEPVPEMSESAAKTAHQFLLDMKATLSDIPDESLTEDWKFLTRCAMIDFAYGVPNTLEDLRATLAAAAQKANARIFLISNGADRKALEVRITTLTSRLGDAAPSELKREDFVNIVETQAARSGDQNPVYLGLVNPDTRNGVIYFASRTHQAYDPTRDAVLDALAGKLYGGGGAHGFFMQTWGAGLAYSNGIGYRERWGGVRYYAERCPDMAETMKFVVGLLPKSPSDIAKAGPTLDYVIALTFGESNAPSTYEERGEAFANDLADGVTPEKVATYRKAILGIRKDPKAFKEITSRMEKVYGGVLIGYGAKKEAREGSTLLLIGPEDQIVSMEKLIEAKEGKTTVARIYPRDFWIRQ